MAENLSMALAELLRKADAEPDLDMLREGVRVKTQALMELEVKRGAVSTPNRCPSAMRTTRSRVRLCLILEVCNYGRRATRHDPIDTHPPRRTAESRSLERVPARAPSGLLEPRGL
jgi:hypothetical protein